MPKVALIKKYGKPDLIEIVDQEIGEPSSNQVLIRHTTAGLNRYDLENRSGLRKIKSLPSIIGIEGVGIIEKLGYSVSEFVVGDRVAYCTAPCGSYSERRVIDKRYLIKLPSDISDDLASAILFKGMMAHCLTHSVFPTSKESIVLIHGASGGVGQLVSQWASSRGAIVIGTTRSDQKNDLLSKNGCQYVLNIKSPDFVERVMEITKNKGVSVVYDPIGAETSKISFESLCRFGLYVSYGQISGAVGNISLSVLNSRSLFITSPSLLHYKRNKFIKSLTAIELFEVIRKGILKININRKYNLSDIVQAHKDMESGALTGFNLIKF